MIVSIKLSIPDEEISDVTYYAKRLKELAKPKYPGYIKFQFVGLKGYYKTKQNKPQNVDTNTIPVSTVPASLFAD